MALRLEYTLVHNSFKQLASASAMSSSEKLPNQIGNHVLFLKYLQGTG